MCLATQIRNATQAANYLNIKNLLDLTCLTVANMIKGAIRSASNELLMCSWEERQHLRSATIRTAAYSSRFSLVVNLPSLLLPAGKSPEEIRKTFNIKNDFTPVRIGPTFLL